MSRSQWKCPMGSTVYFYNHHCLIIIILELQNWKGPYGSLSPATCQEGTVGNQTPNLWVLSQMPKPMVPNLGPPDVLGLQLPEAFTTTFASQDFWELKSKNIWRPKVGDHCSKALLQTLTV